MNQTASTLKIFLQMMRRDFYVRWHHKRDYLINFVILFPLLYVFQWGYVQPSLMFSPDSTTTNSTVFVGCVILLMMITTYKSCVHLLFDREQQKTTQFYVTVIYPRLFIIKEICTTALFVFMLMSPFFVMAKLLLRSNFNTTNTSWPALYAILFFSSFFCASYNVMSMYLLKNKTKLPNLWMRFNSPMMQMGGLFIPWYVINSFSPMLGRLMYANPMIYVTEGLRQAIIGGPQFFPLWLSISMLLVFTLLATLVALQVFKKAIDHI